MQRTMTATRTTETRQRLWRLREETERHLHVLTAKLADETRSQFAEGTLSNHPADISSDMLEAETDLSRVGALRLELEAIDTALARVDAGTYGVCATCGAEIDPERLLVVPLTSTCLRCAQHEDEEYLRHHGTGRSRIT